MVTTLIWRDEMSFPEPIEDSHGVEVKTTAKSKVSEMTIIEIAPQELSFIKNLETMPQEAAQKSYTNLRQDGGLSASQAKMYLKIIDNLRKGTISKDEATEQMEVLCEDPNNASRIINSITVFPSI